LKIEITLGCNLPSNSRDKIDDTLSLDEIQPPVKLVSANKQVLLQTKIEEVKTKQVATVQALVDSGCIWTCIDEEYVWALRGL
jgi:hypothetical protein